MKASRHWQTFGIGLALLLLSLTPGRPHRVNAGAYLIPSSPSPTGEDFPIVQGAGHIFRPALDGREVVVWYARGEDGLDIWGLQLGEDGRARGDQFPFLISGGVGDQAVPAVASSVKGGNHLVVWHTQPSRNADSDVHARYLDSQGRPQGAPFPISAAEGDQLRPAVAYAPAGEAFVVVWQDDRTGNGFDLYARLAPATDRGAGRGAAGGQEFIVSSAPGDQLIPAIACETDEPRCLVVWMDNRNASVFDTDVLGRLIDVVTGEAIGDEIDVAVARWYQDSPAVVYNPVSGEYMVVWNDDISCRRVSRNGRPQGAKIDISLESPFQYKPAISVNAAGNYLVVWEDGRNQPDHGTDIYAQWLSPAGLPIERNFAISNDHHNQYTPALIFDPQAQVFFVVWADDRRNDNLVLYGRRLSHASPGQ